MIIVTPLKNATVTGLATTCGQGTIYDLGALESAQSLYAGFHVLSTGIVGNDANPVTVKIFTASSSGGGFNALATCRFGFVLTGCRDSTWAAPVTGAFAACQRFYRADWFTSCTGKKLLVWVSRCCIDPA